jgi:hypothetical protein
MYNPEVYYQFLKTNSWYRTYYPNLPEIDTTRENPARYLARAVEWFLSGDRGNRLDDWCLQLTRKYLARKYRHLEPERFQSDLQTSKGISKHHPHRQQFRVLDHYQETIGALETTVFVKETNLGLLAGYGESA